MRSAGAIFDRVIGALFDCASVLMGCCVAAVAIEITHRTLTGRPQIGVVEGNEYALLIITFLSAAWLLKKDAHVKMDVIINRLKPRTQAILNIVTSIIAAFFCLILVWYGSEVTLESFQKGITFFKAMELPKGPIMMFIPICFFLLTIQFIRNIRNYLTQRETPEL